MRDQLIKFIANKRQEIKEETAHLKRYNTVHYAEMCAFSGMSDLLDELERELVIDAD